MVVSRSTHLLYFSRRAPEELDVPAADAVPVLAQSLGRVLFLGEEHERVTRGSAVGLLHEQNPVLAVLDLARLLPGREELELREGRGQMNILSVFFGIQIIEEKQIKIASTHNLLGGAVVGEAAHAHDDLGTPREEGVGLAAGATGYGDKVLARGLVDLDVAGVYVVLVPLEGHVPVLLAHESDESLAVAPALHAQAQSYAAPALK